MGQTGENAKFVLNNGGPNGVRRVKTPNVLNNGVQMGQTGQNAKFVLNNGGPNGSDGSKRQIRAEQWGSKWVRRVKTLNSC